MIIDPSSPMLSDSSHTTFSSSVSGSSNRIFRAFSYEFTSKDLHAVDVRSRGTTLQVITKKPLVRGKLPITIQSTVCTYSVCKLVIKVFLRFVFLYLHKCCG